ncbi:MAG: 2,3-cyclic 3-phosphodiesterase [Acidobacteriota bacterium]|jgi:2'-5' RNA ligase|nr:2,3-cyclic 3-phosphodiesterase [Acidobacteriota bacterium]
MVKEIQAEATHERWRVFCAVELPPEVRERAADHAAHLRERSTEARASWPRTDNLHLTLKFLGEIAQTRVEALSNAASLAARSVQPFDLTIEGAGTFPPRGLPRVLWLGINDPSGSLARLQSSLEEECASAGFAREERPFHPHLTLARIRAPQGARRLATLHRETGFAAIEFKVTDMVVMRSDLGAGGSRYTEISRHEFGVIQPL